MNWPSVEALIRSASSKGRRKNFWPTVSQKGQVPSSSNQPRSSASTVSANRVGSAPISR